MQNFVHGFEYLAVTAKVDSQAKKTYPALKRLLVFTGVTGLVAILLLQRIVDKSAGTWGQGFAFGSLTTTLSLISISISFTHYYYDSQIFRFSKPELRKNFLPVLSE